MRTGSVGAGGVGAELPKKELMGFAISSFLPFWEAKVAACGATLKVGSFDKVISVNFDCREVPEDGLVSDLTSVTFFLRTTGGALGSLGFLGFLTLTAAVLVVDVPSVVGLALLVLPGLRPGFFRKGTGAATRKGRLVRWSFKCELMQQVKVNGNDCQILTSSALFGVLCR